MLVLRRQAIGLTSTRSLLYREHRVVSFFLCVLCGSVAKSRKLPENHFLLDRIFRLLYNHYTLLITICGGSKLSLSKFSQCGCYSPVYMQFQDFARKSILGNLKYSDSSAFSEIANMHGKTFHATMWHKFRDPDFLTCNSLILNGLQGGQ